MTMRRLPFPTTLQVLVCAASLALVASAPLEAAVKERFYPMGESDPGAAIGQPASMTADILDSGADQAGALVPLEVLNGGEPVYASGRFGDDLSLSFDGAESYLQSAAFDPRNFGGSFAALSQAWVKPDPAGFGEQQAIWGLGTDNGGVGITADGTWQLRASSRVPDSDSGEPVAFDAWTHVAVLRGGNSASLFVNGERVSRFEAFWDGVGEVVVGAALDGSIPFHGLIDDFNIAGFSDGVFNAVDDLDFFDPENFTGVDGDVNQDGNVDISDYLIWSDNVGFDNGQGAGDATTLLRGDVDGNGRVNFFDFQIIRDIAAQNGAPLNVPVPEPTSGVLLAIGLFAVQHLRRQK